MTRLDPTEMLNLLEQSKDAVATLTGLKQQFIDAGWTPRGAEQMTYAILLQQTR